MFLNYKLCAIFAVEKWINKNFSNNIYKLKIKKMSKTIKNFKWSLLMMAFPAVFLTSGCDEDNTPGPSDITAVDGYYISGDATLYGTDSLNVDATLKTSINEVDGMERTTLKSGYVALKGGSNFKITRVANFIATNYGPGAGFATVDGTVEGLDQPQIEFQKGEITENSSSFAVPTDGLYQIVFDTELLLGAVIPVSNWALIGDATVINNENGTWTDDIPLNNPTFNQSSMTWSLSDVGFDSNKAFKFRHSGGWKVVLNDDVKVNTNLGGSLLDLQESPTNLAVETAIYDIGLTWNAGAGYTADFTKTDDLVILTDLAARTYGFSGAGINDANGNANDWYTVLYNELPTVNGYMYTWTYNGVDLNGGEFKIRSENDDIWLGTEDVIFGGPDESLIGSSGGTYNNFVTTSPGLYNFTITIDENSANPKPLFSVTKQ